MLKNIYKQKEGGNMIYIYAPFYCIKSNGIAVIYEFLRILNRSGMEARILCHENERYDVELPEDLKPYYISKAAIPERIPDDDIVIYLDTAVGNVIEAKQVVYWLLNKPGALTGQPIDFQPSDVLVAYSTLVHEELPQLFILKDERELFSRLRNQSKKRTDTVSLYFGKVNVKTILDKNAQLKKIIKKYKRINIITRFSPSDRETTLRCIAQSDLLISYDSLSNINYEATLLGTPVLMMQDAYKIEHIAFNVGNYGFAFSKDGIKPARSMVGHAFIEYCKWLDNQEASVVSSVQHIIKQMVQIKSDPQSLQANKLANEKAKADFEAFYENLREPFTNINFPSEIPYETRRIIRMSCEVMRVNRANNTNKNKSGNAKTTTLRKMYSNHKPSWINDTYRKIPGDLRLHELIFLAFRRMFVVLKRKRFYHASKGKSMTNTGKI